MTFMLGDNSCDLVKVFQVQNCVAKVLSWFRSSEIFTRTNKTGVVRI